MTRTEATPLSKATTVRIYPVEHSGTGMSPYIDGVPATVTDCDPVRAEWLVSSGAFTYTEPVPQGPAPAEPASPEETDA